MRAGQLAILMLTQLYTLQQATTTDSLLACLFLAIHGVVNVILVALQCEQ